MVDNISKIVYNYSCKVEIRRQPKQKELPATPTKAHADSSHKQERTATPPPNRSYNTTKRGKNQV